MDRNHSDSVCKCILKNSGGNKFLVLITGFVAMLLIIGGVSNALDTIGFSERNALLLGSVLQCLFCFIFPAWLTAEMCEINPYKYLGVSTGVRPSQFYGTLIFMIITIPIISWLVDWNAGLSLPKSLHDMEQLMRNMEDNAAVTTSVLLGDSSVWGLMSGILIIGILTGVAEESFFRAGIQKTMTSSGINAHLAVWISASIFSAIHFQFFGFVPRMVLGACFGYLYFYSDSLWVPSFAHAFNNSLVVISTWLIKRGVIKEEFDDAISSNDQFSLILIAGIIMSVLFIIFFWNKWIDAKGSSLNIGLK